MDDRAGGRRDHVLPVPRPGRRSAVDSQRAGASPASTASTARAFTPRTGRASRSISPESESRSSGRARPRCRRSRSSRKVAGHLTVFQRSPNWCAPLRNGPIDHDTHASIRSRYPEIFELCRNTYGGFIHDADRRKALEVSDEERLAFYEELYAQRGFGIWMGNFRDVLVDASANATLSEFMAEKIRERIADPELAEKLIPTDHGFGTKRVPLETGYYEVYNQPHVELVDLRETPIVEVTASGITHDGKRARVRRHRARDGVRRGDRAVRTHRHPRRRWRSSRRRVGRRSSDVPGHRSRSLSEPVHPRRPAQRGDVLQHAPLHRAQRRVGGRPARAHGGTPPDARRGRSRSSTSVDGRGARSRRAHALLQGGVVVHGEDLGQRSDR